MTRRLIHPVGPRGPAKEVALAKADTPPIRPLNVPYCESAVDGSLEVCDCGDRLRDDDERGGEAPRQKEAFLPSFGWTVGLLLIGWTIFGILSTHDSGFGGFALTGYGWAFTVAGACFVAEALVCLVLGLIARVVAKGSEIAVYAFALLLVVVALLAKL